MISLQEIANLLAARPIRFKLANINAGVDKRLGSILGVREP